MIPVNKTYKGAIMRVTDYFSGIDRVKTADNAESWLLEYGNKKLLAIRYQNMMAGVSSPKYDGMPKGHSNNNATEDKMIEVVDKRNETHAAMDRGKVRTIDIEPDIVADWTKRLPFEDNSFHLVVFDPPHLIHAGKTSWLVKKYGVLNKDTWQSDIAKGFDEAMRVLKPYGTLVSKWNDDQIKLKDVLATIDYKPLFGDKRSKTHWLIFMKVDEEDEN